MTEAIKTGKRQRHVFPTNEVAHIWARQTQHSGRNAGGNLYFEGNTIYSYGNHFPIAKFVTPELVLFTTRGYSNTTAKHIGKVRHAIPPTVRIVKVDNINADFKGAHEKNLELLWANVVSLCKNNSRSRKCDNNNQIGLKLLNIAKYSRWCKLGRTKRLAALLESIGSPLLWGRVIGLSDEETATINAKKAARVEADRERDAAKERAEQERVAHLFPQVVEAWRKGKPTNYVGEGNERQYIGDLLYRLPTLLKLSSDGSEVITSRGARITTETAKRLWPILKARQVPDDIEGYRAVGFDKSDELVVGCHRIPFGELELIARELGLEPSLEENHVEVPSSGSR